MGSVEGHLLHHDVDILIIGGGLSGCYALHKLRQIQPTPTIKLVEAGSDFGGVWHHNRYPGARVDSEYPVYQFSIPEVWKTWNYSDRFPDRSQLREYFEHMVDVLDLRRDSIFNTIIDGVDWDEDRKRWDTSASSGSSFTSRYLIICTGSSYKIYYPDFEGIEKFKGTLLHSAAFPEDGINVTGKRIGVIGAGATGVQIIQELAKKDCHLINFIRTPNNALPLRQRKVSLEDERNLKTGGEKMFKSLRKSAAGLPNAAPTKSYEDCTDEERDAVFQKAWDKGGFAFIADTFPDFWTSEAVNAHMYQFWASRVRARVTDPSKRDILAPLPQRNYFSMKRPPLEQDYYECMDRPNVTLVNVREEDHNPIREITETGVVTADGTSYEMDILILATGFDAMNGSQKDLGLRDRHGVSLREKWKQGTHAYLGLTIPGCPNAFMSYGPGGPTALGNAPPIIETACDWIFNVIQKMEDDGIATVTPTLDAAKKWQQDIQDVSKTMLSHRENSWWMGANIPGKYREQLNYQLGLEKYAEVIGDAVDGWKGFEVVRKEM